MCGQDMILNQRSKYNTGLQEHQVLEDWNILLFQKADSTVLPSCAKVWQANHKPSDHDELITEFLIPSGKWISTLLGLRVTVHIYDERAGFIITAV